MKAEIKLNIELSERPEMKHVRLCDKVKEFIDCCESDNNSDYHWKYLKSLYNKLNAKSHLNAEGQEIMSILSPYIIEHSSHIDGEDSHVDVEGVDMFKFNPKGL